MVPRQLYGGGGLAARESEEPEATLSAADFYGKLFGVAEEEMIRVTFGLTIDDL